MTFHFVTLFPNVFSPLLSTSVLGRGLERNLFSFQCYNPRDFALDSHKSVDDHPYGGGAGMVMRADILEKCLLSLLSSIGIDYPYASNRCRVVCTSAAGTPYIQQTAVSFTKYEHIVLICGHYEGIDQRFIDMYCQEEISVGNFVMTGGELPALAIADSVIRLLPNVLGDASSVIEESFSEIYNNLPLVEYPHYTRPELFHDQGVPKVLLSGNHAEIAKWRKEESLTRTHRRK